MFYYFLHLFLALIHDEVKNIMNLDRQIPLPPGSDSSTPQSLSSRILLVFYNLFTVQSSWGQNTDFSKAFWTGTAKSYGQYELCVDVTKGTDGSPWDAQYCGLQYPRVTLDLFQAVIRAYIGSCWPSSCTSKDLEIAHRTRKLDFIFNFKAFNHGMGSALCLY